MVSKEFVLGGKATLTIENNVEWASKNAAPAHWTFKINKKDSMQLLVSIFCEQLLK